MPAIWGRTRVGRALMVAVYHVSGFTWKIVGARDMTDIELAEFTEVMVVRSLRLPIEVDEAVAAASQVAGVPKTTWIRQAIEIALALQAEEDQPISHAEALRALTLLRPVRRVACSARPGRATTPLPHDVIHSIT